jgi:ADP-heptose:LPS heptosyltransferase
MAKSSPLIVVLSFRTFGDYILRTPFLRELFLRNPSSRILLITNNKGRLVYPLLDSRLTVIAFDHDTPKSTLLASIARLQTADVLYATDNSRTTVLLALMIRARRKIGYYQNESSLYGPGGFRIRYATARWLSLAARLCFTQALLRLPEDQHDSRVELNLLGITETKNPLSFYRSEYARPPGVQPPIPVIYCSAEAGWIARQLTDIQWSEIVARLLAHFPAHEIVFHGSQRLLDQLPKDLRVRPLGQRSISELFDLISAADLVIAADSFALHIASLYDTPTIGYFGPSHPHRFRSTSPKSISLFHQPPCSPCLQNRGDELCASGLRQCTSLAQMTSDEFLSAAESILTRR